MASAGKAAPSERSPRFRRRRINEAKQRMRALRIELSVLNHQVGSRVELKDVDLDCLEVITEYGPISPSGLARRVGVRLATMTGILDRLERGGWIARSRDDIDRRGVLVRGLPDRQREIFQLYGGMNRSLDEILEGYPDEQIDVIIDFLQRCTQAGSDAASVLGTPSRSTGRSGRSAALAHEHGADDELSPTQ